MGFFYSGGGERVALQEAKCLRQRGHEVDVFAPIIRWEKCFPELLRKVGPKELVAVFPTPICREAAAMLMCSILPMGMKSIRDCDVLLCHSQPSMWIGYRMNRLFGLRYVAYLHQPARFLYPRHVDSTLAWKTRGDWLLLDNLLRLTRPVVRALDHASVISAEAVFANSAWTASSATKIYGFSPIVCSPGVDTESFAPTQRKHDVAIRGLKVKNQFVLTTNRHYPQKGIEYAIAIMPEVLKEVDTNLVITGDFTNYTAKLIRLCRNLHVENQVIFTGQIREQALIELYQNATVYVYTSPCEDFGLGPLEAMSCGTPAVVWDYAGPAETVIDGLTGYRAKPYKIEDLATKVIELIRDPGLNRKMSENGVRHVRQNHSWSKHVDIIEREMLQVPKPRYGESS